VVMLIIANSLSGKEKMAAKKLNNWSRSIISDEHIVDIIKEYNYPSKPNLHSSNCNSSPIIKEYNYLFSLQLQLLKLPMKGSCILAVSPFWNSSCPMVLFSFLPK
jgi:hypothetical protein